MPNEFDFKTTRIGNNPERVHKLVSDCHRQSLGSREPVVIACPDMVFATGALKALENRMSKGKRLVMVPSPRLHRPKVLPLLRPHMSPRELSALAIENLHPGFDLMFWGNHPFTDTPYQIYWKTDHGLVVRCFHMHPLLIWPERRAHFNGTVDDDCVDLFGTTETCVITDSDEIACFEMSPTMHTWQKEGEQRMVKNWINRKTNKMHRWFFTHECHIHTGRMDTVTLPPELMAYA